MRIASRSEWRAQISEPQRKKPGACGDGQLDPAYALFALVLAWAGARVSEVLALTPSSFQIDSSIVTIVTLKRRKHSIREIPLPPGLMQSLNRFFRLQRLQREDNAPGRLWTFCRMTAWRIVKRVMRLARVVGPQACPRGLRHGFGVGSLQAGVPVTLVQRWMGHARLSTTSIYLNVCGPEEIAFARHFWRGTSRAGVFRPRSSVLVKAA